jgi:hypothetical protein
MKRLLSLVQIFAFLLISGQCLAAETPLLKGQQPNIGIDEKGILRMVYGEDNKIYVVTSKDKGISFSKPVQVAVLPGMHLGNSRGPQIASSKNFSLITAIDKRGNIHSYKLNHSRNTWTKFGDVNDTKGSAEEGLMALTADKLDNFYAVWLDTRLKKKNNIYFSSLDRRTVSWKANQLVYKSVDEHVCECCKPNIYFNNNKLVISFRNWLMGSRDIYYTSSADKGQTFSPAIKSGKGTWKLNGCPMDGGGIVVNDQGTVSAAWQRAGDIFYAIENRPEQKVGSGRSVNMAQSGNRTMIAWQDKNTIKVYNPGTKEVSSLGEGTSPRLYLLPDGKSLCVWEGNKSVYLKRI